MTREARPEMQKMVNVTALLDELARVQNEAECEHPPGWELPEALRPEFSDLAADILGIPKESFDCDTSEGFCRDGFYHSWLEVVRGDVASHDFIEKILTDYAEWLK